MLKTLRTIDYHKELIEILFGSKVGAFSTTILVPIFFVLLFKDLIPMHLLLIWMAAQVLVFIIRMTIASKGLKIVTSVDKKTLNRYLKFYLLTIFTNAFLWGIASIILTLYAQETDLYIFFILIIGMTSAASSTLATVFHAFFIYLCTIMSLSALSFVFITATPTGYMLAIFALIYSVVTLSAAFKNYSSMNRNIQQNEELKEQNSNFQNLLDTTMEAIIISDEHHKIIESNQAGAILFNLKDKSEFLGRHITEFVPEYELPKLQESLQVKYDPPREYDLLKDDGTLFPVLASGRDMVKNGKKVRISIILDLSQIKKQELQLLQQSRLAQMGEMISMIAHQWRQPLGAISSTTVNLKIKIELESFDLETQESRDACNNYFLDKLSDIEEFSQNLTTTIDDFRNFYKPNKHSAAVTFEHVTTKALNIIKSLLINENIELIYEYHSEEKVEMYDGEMMQVLLNILKNAQDNFREKAIKNPKITIRTFDKSISICDNGGGIPKNIMLKIFDPYFSTKTEKNGTGLGLYMSKTIIEEHHNGHLHIKNQDDGVCFTIDLNKRES